MLHRSYLGRRFIGLGLAAACVVLPLVGLAPSAVATPITYSFLGASAVFGGATETITGGFTFDVATGFETNVSITLSGPSAFSGTYTAASLGYAGNVNEISAQGINAALTIYFASPLSSATDNLSFVGTANSPFGATVVVASSPTGSVSPVPEPSAVALLAIGLLGIGVVRRSRSEAP